MNSLTPKQVDVLKAARRACGPDNIWVHAACIGGEEAVRRGAPLYSNSGWAISSLPRLVFDGYVEEKRFFRRTMYRLTPAGLAKIEEGER